MIRSTLKQFAISEGSKVLKLPHRRTRSLLTLKFQAIRSSQEFEKEFKKFQFKNRKPTSCLGPHQSKAGTHFTCQLIWQKFTMSARVSISICFKLPFFRIRFECWKSHSYVIFRNSDSVLVPGRTICEIQFSLKTFQLQLAVTDRTPSLTKSESFQIRSTRIYANLLLQCNRTFNKFSPKISGVWVATKTSFFAAENCETETSKEKLDM